VPEYKRLLQNNITKDYKTREPVQVSNTNSSAKILTETLELADRIDKYIEIDAYITLKDHKDGFPGKIDSRLINPAKSNLGKISKRFLEDAVRVIRRKYWIQPVEKLWRSD